MVSSSLPQPQYSGLNRKQLPFLSLYSLFGRRSAEKCVQYTVKTREVFQRVWVALQ